MADPLVAYVDCPGDSEAEIKGCGTQGLTQEQYERQLSNPWATWRCPCCDREADYNDELSEKAQGISDEPYEDWPAAISI
jgi:hypothetical protein